MPSPIKSSDDLLEANGTCKEDKELINRKLYQLVETVNIDMDYQVFCIVVDLLRAGICPEALFVFFSNIYPYTRTGLKLAARKKSRRSLPSQN